MNERSGRGPVLHTFPASEAAPHKASRDEAEQSAACHTRTGGIGVRQNGAGWEVFGRDGNGNRILLATCATEQEAERIARMRQAVSIDVDELLAATDEAAAGLVKARMAKSSNQSRP